MFWEKINNRIVFYRDKENHVKAKINNYFLKGSLQEELHCSFIQILDKSKESFNNYYDVLIQMSIKPIDKETDLSGGFYKIRRKDIHKYHLSIKLDYVQKMITQIEKFNLKDIIELYDSDPIARRAGNQHQRKFNLEYLRFVCHFLKFKINRNDISTLGLEPITDLETFESLGEELRPARDVSSHASLHVISRIDSQTILQHQIVMFKTSFTTKPL